MNESPCLVTRPYIPFVGSQTRIALSVACQTPHSEEGSGICPIRDNVVTDWLHAVVNPCAMIAFLHKLHIGQIPDPSSE